MVKWMISLLCCYFPFTYAVEIDERCNLPKALCELELSYVSADLELNKAYQDILRRIKSGKLSETSLVEAGELKQSLVESQRSWIKFRDKNCEAFYTLNSGGMQRNEALVECQIDMTKARTEYLKEWYL